MNDPSVSDGVPRATRLARAILQLIVESRGPVGQDALSFLLRQRGVVVSAPTVGRRLRDLEFAGMLRKVSVEGRVVTQRGRQALKQWLADAHFRTSGRALLDALRREDKDHLIDLLAARCVVETEAAGLAATHASPEAILRMESALAREMENIMGGGLGAAEDVAFHQEIGRASGNAVLASLISLMRHNRRYNVIVTSMRAAVGAQLAMDHEAILDGIRRHDPQAARHAMDRHLKNLIRDLDRYWARERFRKDSDTGEPVASRPRSP
jgi:DNA-binding FadR family transcriptional regulator